MGYTDVLLIVVRASSRLQYTLVCRPGKYHLVPLVVTGKCIRIAGLVKRRRRTIAVRDGFLQQTDRFLKDVRVAYNIAFLTWIGLRDALDKLTKPPVGDVVAVASVPDVELPP